MFEENTDLSARSHRIGPKQSPTISTRDESKDSVFEEITNSPTTSQPIRPNQLTTISTRYESQDSLFEATTWNTSIPPNLVQMNTKSQQRYVDSLINPAIAQKIANRNESNREESYDSLLEVTFNEASIATDQPNKSSHPRIHEFNSRSSYSQNYRR